MFTISNDKQKIVSTNYWHSDHAKKGYYFLSWNAGAARLLVPKVRTSQIKDMKTGEIAIVSRGVYGPENVEAYEILFEDYSDTPFAITIILGQADRTLSDDSQGGGFDLVVWTDEGVQLTLPAKYRRVDTLPCLKEWIEQ